MPPLLLWCDPQREWLDLLRAHARECFDKPKKTWEELTRANAKSALADDHRMLQVLGGADGEFERLRAEERFDLCARRAVEDFGLPDPRSHDERAWRVAATARLLCTEATEAVPHEPPSEGDRIVPAGLARKRTLDLLKAWQNHVLYIATFEELARAADATVGLGYWARNLPTAPRSRSSRLVEKTIFDQAIDRLDRVEDVDGLAKELEQNLQSYQYRERGFWAQQSTERIGWRHLIQLADVASLLVENHEVDRPWKNPTEAVQWYERNGWQLDLAGERLFREATDLPPQMHRIRARLRRGYLRTMDRISRSFSELLTKAPAVRVKPPERVSGSPADGSFTHAICLEPGLFPPGFDALSSLPTAGELVLAELPRQSVPTALVFLDACRLDLGQRLKDMLNKGEPVQRANVSVAAAPVPSITAIGMALALPVSRERLSVRLSEDGSEFVVTAADFSGDLAVAEQRRRWLTQQFGVRDHLGIDQVLDGETLKRPAKARKVKVVLKPVGHIAGFSPRVQLQAGATGQSTMFADSDMLARQAVVKVRDPASGKVVFKHREPVTVDPDGAAVIVPLEIVEPRPELAYNTPLEILVVDADDEEILAREAITLKVAIDDWS